MVSVRKHSKTHRRARRGAKSRSKTQKGGFLQTLLAHAKKAKDKAMEAISGKPAAPAPAPVAAPTPDAAAPMKPFPAPSAASSQAQEGGRRRRRGGFMSALKGHLNKVSAAAAVHTDKMKDAQFPVPSMASKAASAAKKSASELKVHVNNVAKAVKAHPMGSDAKGHLQRFHSAAAAHITYGGAQTQRLLDKTSSELGNHMSKLNAMAAPHMAKAKVTGTKAVAGTTKVGKNLMGMKGGRTRKGKKRHSSRRKRRGGSTCRC